MAGLAGHVAAPAAAPPLAGRAAAALLRPRSLAGLALWALGSARQARCHAALARLRRAPAGGGGSGGVYGVPRGAGFDSASCAHYAAEVQLYAGLALLAGLHARSVRCF